MQKYVQESSKYIIKQIKEELLINEEKVVRDKYDLKSEISVSGLSARTTKYKFLPKIKQEAMPLDEVSYYTERKK